MTLEQRLRDAQETLGIALPMFPRGMSAADMREAWEAWKAGPFNDHYRALLRANHPDRGGSTERMAAINDARDVLLSVEPVPPRPPPQPVVIIDMGSFSSASTSTVTMGGGFIVINGVRIAL